MVRVSRPRHLDWDGCWNARDLGGLRTGAGGRIRWGALVRSDHLVHVSAAGWAALVAHGVRTVVDLRTSFEVDRHRQVLPPGIRVVREPLEEGLESDPEFASWIADGTLASPVYPGSFVRRWPDRCARAVAAVAHAPPGGVLVHCAKGCDRTGMIVLQVLLLCGVDAETIADDYALTAERVRSDLARSLGRDDDEAEILDVLERHGRPRDVREAVRAAVGEVDHRALLRSGGLTGADEEALRARLLEPA